MFEIPSVRATFFSRNVLFELQSVLDLDLTLSGRGGRVTITVWCRARVWSYNEQAQRKESLCLLVAARELQSHDASNLRRILHYFH